MWALLDLSMCLLKREVEQVIEVFVIKRALYGAISIIIFHSIIKGVRDVIIRGEETYSVN